MSRLTTSIKHKVKPTFFRPGDLTQRLFLLRFLNDKLNKNTPDSKRELDERPRFIDLSVENKQISITTAEVMNKVSLIIGPAARLTPSGCKGC